MPDAPTALWLLNPTGQRAGGGFVDDTLRKRADDQGLGNRYALAGDFPRQRVEVIRGPDGHGVVNELYYRRGWTDGLPIVPPTLESVDAMLAGTMRPRSDSLGELDPLRGVATVEKVAANAVMAGCQAQQLPMVLAAVEAIADPQFNLRGVQTTDENVSPLLIYSGPESERYELNGDLGALGPGWRGNASIGRALRLVMNNIGGGWPGAVSLAGLANPARYSLCFAENELKNPWPSLREDLGFKLADNVLVVMRAESVINVTGGLDEVADVMGSAASLFAMAHGGKVAVALSPYTVRELDAAGMNKSDVQIRLFEQGRISREKLESFWIRHTIARTQWPEWLDAVPLADDLPVVQSPEDITIVVSGGDLAIAQHAYFPSWGFPACRIARRLESPTTGSASTRARTADLLYRTCE